MMYFSQATLLPATLLLAASSAFGVPTVSVDADPSTPGVQSSLTVVPGDAFAVDVFISDVDVSTPVNGFQFNLGFDPAVLTAVSATEGDFLLDPTFTLISDIDNVIGDVLFSSVTLLPGGAVGEGVLATVGFQAAASGVSVLDLSNVLLSAPFGIPIDVGQVNDGQVSVTPEGVVPEPHTLAILALGLVGLAGSGRYSRRRRR